MEAMDVGTQVVSTDVLRTKKVLVMANMVSWRIKGMLSIVSALRQACINPLDKSVLAESVERFEPNKIGREYIQFFEKISVAGYDK